MKQYLTGHIYVIMYNLTLFDKLLIYRSMRHRGAFVMISEIKKFAIKVYILTHK